MMAPLLERFRRDITGILWAAGAIFIAMALLSFNPADPSFNSVSKGALRHMATVANLCGYFGSFLSDILYQLLGASAWVLVFGAARMSVKSFRGKSGPLTLVRVLWGTLLVIVLASFGGLYFPNTRIFGGQIAVGGLLGLLVSRGLIGVFNKGGVGVILWTSTLVLALFFITPGNQAF